MLRLMSLWLHVGPLGDSVHGEYFIVCPVYKDRTGCDREGKETQHSFKELDLLGGNNSMEEKQG